MRPTRRVNKLGQPAMVILACVAFLPQQQAGVRTIDLTRPEEHVSQLLAAPAVSSASPRYDLPLVIQITDVQFGADNPARIDLTVRNVGEMVFDLPVSRDAAKVLQEGNTQRKTFLYTAELRATKPKLAAEIPLLALNSSVSVPQSEYRLAPNETVKIRLPADLRVLQQWRTKGIKDAELDVVCSEWVLENSRFRIATNATPLRSEHVFKISLARARDISSPR